MQTSTADSIAALRGPEGAAALRTIFDEFLPTTRRYHGFTWVISHRDLLALRSSNQGAKLTQEQKLPLYKCLFTNHKIDTNTTPLSFAGPVIQLDGLLGFLARQLLQRRKGASVTIPKVLQSTRDSDPYEKSILQEQIELYLLFSNADAKAAVEEFSSKTLVQVCPAFVDGKAAAISLKLHVIVSSFAGSHRCLSGRKLPHGAERHLAPDGSRTPPPKARSCLLHFASATGGVLAATRLCHLHISSFRATCTSCGWGSI